MAHPHHHAESSARKFGGVAADYAFVHDWFDAAKIAFGGFSHRAVRHHAFGIFEAERVFGRTLTNSDGRVVPIRFIGEQHVREDCGGRVPSLQDWVERIAPAAWMSIGHILEDAPAAGSATVAEWAAEVAAGRTILGYLDWIDAGRRESAVRAVLDVSTGHLSPATRAQLDALADRDAPVDFLRGAHGWLIHACTDAAARWPQDLAAVLAHAVAARCDYVLFDADAPVLDALPWREDGEDPA